MCKSIALLAPTALPWAAASMAVVWQNVTPSYLRGVLPLLHPCPERYMRPSRRLSLRQPLWLQQHLALQHRLSLYLATALFRHRVPCPLLLLP